MSRSLRSLANHPSWRASEASETLSGVYKFELVRYVYIYIYIYILVMCSVSTNGERAGLGNSKLTIDSLLESSYSVKSLVDRLS